MHVNTVSVKIIYWSLQNVNHRKPPCPRTSTQPTSRDECNDESTNSTDHLEHPDPAYVGQPNTNRQHCPWHEMWSYERDGRWWGWSFVRGSTVPTTHTKTHSDDYTYIINESPKSVKLKCILMQDAVTSRQKRLKRSQTKSRRLRRKVESLQTVVKTLKETYAVRSSDRNVGENMWCSIRINEPTSERKTYR